MKEISDKSWQAFVTTVEVHQSLTEFALNKGVDSAVVDRCSIRDALYLINDAELFLLEYIPNAEQDLAYKLFAQRVHDRGGKIILLSTKDNMPDFNWLTSVGIDSVDIIPIDQSRLELVFNDVCKSNPSIMSTCAKIISFVKFKPNNGSFTCALNTAAMLSKKHKTLIIDFDLYFSPSSTFFDFAKNNYLEELLENPDRIDGQLIFSSVIKISKDLFILSSSVGLDKSMKYSKTSIDKLIVSCSEIYEYIVIYLPFSEDVYSHPALMLSDFLVGVINLDSANKRSIKSMMPLLLKTNNLKNIHIVVNQVKKSLDISMDVFFKDLEIKPAGKISFHESLMADARKEKTIAFSLDPGSKFSHELSYVLMKVGLISKSVDFIFLKKIKDFIKKLIEKINDK